MEKHYLWYDNGTDYFCCASSHDSLSAAIDAAKSGFQARQHITPDSDGKEIVWDNYKTVTVSSHLGTGERGAARKAALTELARANGHMYNGEPSIGRFLCDLADKAHTKPPLEPLDDSMRDTTAPMGPQSLDWLEDAIVIRQQQIMSMRLSNYGIETITGENEYHTWINYLLVIDHASERTAYADLAECRVLLDTVREMKDPAAAFERWLPKVKEVRDE